MNAFWLEQVEAYLEGKITRADLQVVADQEGIEDVELEINWLRDNQLAIEATGLKEQLNHVLPQIQQSAPKVRRLGYIRPLIAIAASILFLIVAFIIFNQENTAELYAQYEYIDPGLPILMSQSEDHLFYDAMTYYSEENYQVAAEKLYALFVLSPSNDTLAYYLGASQLYNGQTSAAVSTLESVLKNNESVFLQRAEWLQVLALLKENDYKEAKRLVDFIRSNPDHTFYDQAVRLEIQLQETTQ